MQTRILISDDSPIFRRTLRNLLESVGQWEVIETRDGSEAVSQAIATQPDVVVLDLAMPVKDGLTAAREIGQALPNTPIVMCTMHNSPQMEIEAQKAGARVTISKANSTAIVPILQELLAARPPRPPGEPTLDIPVPAILTSTAPPESPATVKPPADPASVVPGPEHDSSA